jgi:NADH:ubiquinone oxidoreductase subunit 6 (subunit J)
MINIQKILNNLYLGIYNIRERFGSLLSLFYVRIYLIIILGLNSLNWFFVYVININIAEQDSVILHYNVDFGIDLIGNVRQIYIIPSIGLVIVLFNLILLFFAYRKNIVPERRDADKFLANLLLGSALFVNFILLFSVASIYLINFFR